MLKKYVMFFVKIGVFCSVLVSLDIFSSDVLDKTLTLDKWDKILAENITQDTAQLIFEEVLKNDIRLDLIIKCLESPFCLQKVKEGYEKSTKSYPEQMRLKRNLDTMKNFYEQNPLEWHQALLNVYTEKQKYDLAQKVQQEVNNLETLKQKKEEKDKERKEELANREKIRQETLARINQQKEAQKNRSRGKVSLVIPVSDVDNQQPFNENTLNADIYFQNNNQNQNNVSQVNQPQQSLPPQSLSPFVPAPRNLNLASNNDNMQQQQSPVQNNTSWAVSASQQKPVLQAQVPMSQPIASLSQTQQPLNQFQPANFKKNAGSLGIGLKPVSSLPDAFKQGYTLAKMSGEPLSKDEFKAMFTTTILDEGKKPRFDKAVDQAKAACAILNDHILPRILKDNPSEKEQAELENALNVLNMKYENDAIASQVITALIDDAYNYKDTLAYGLGEPYRGLQQYTSNPDYQRIAIS